MTMLQPLDARPASAVTQLEAEPASAAAQDGADPEPERRRSGRGGRTPRKKLSRILAETASDTRRDRISVGDLVDILQARAFGALLLIFALPNVLPTPPGTSGILGLPLIYLSAQMMLGRRPWLPQLIAGRSMGREDFAALVGRVSPLLERAERLLVERHLYLATDTAQRGLGAICLALALVLVLPIPLGNILPALAISLIALGVLERDGLWIACGTIVALTSMIIVYGVLYALFRSMSFLLLSALG